MVEKNVSGVYTQIVYSPLGGKFAVMSGQTMQKAWIPLPTGAKAIYTSSGLGGWPTFSIVKLFLLKSNCSGCPILCGFSKDG
jgi:hypothetical protein